MGVHLYKEKKYTSAILLLTLYSNEVRRFAPPRPKKFPVPLRDEDVRQVTVVDGRQRGGTTADPGLSPRTEQKPADVGTKDTTRSPGGPTANETTGSGS